MKEKEWEKLLRIKTTGRDDTRSDTFRYPYEPTSYEVLERLANTGIIGKNNTLLDYGCGKGTFLAKFHLLISIPLPVHSPELPHLPRPMYRNKPKSSGNGEAFPVHGTLYCKVTLIYGTK